MLHNYKTLKRSSTTFSLDEIILEVEVSQSHNHRKYIEYNDKHFNIYVKVTKFKDFYQRNKRAMQLTIRA